MLLNGLKTHAYVLESVIRISAPICRTKYPICRPRPSRGDCPLMGHLFLRLIYKALVGDIKITDTPVKTTMDCLQNGHHSVWLLCKLLMETLT